jgi:hypothetical protein
VSGYLKKLAAYYDYLASGRYDQDYVGFPTILVVAANNAAEERIVHAARAARVGRMHSLPLLVTCLWRIHDGRNSLGALGQIWRCPEADFSDRQLWSLPTDIGMRIRGSCPVESTAQKHLDLRPT